MYISIIGCAGSGKTTLFRALTGLESPDGTKGGTVAIIDVPDERVDRLAEVFHPKKTVYARIELSDTVALREGDAKNETIPAKSLQQMRLSDAFLLVLRSFSNGTPPDPLSEFHAISSEFLISDMVQIEKRLERIDKQGGKKENPALQQEKGALEECLRHLNEEKPLSTLPLIETDGKILRNFQFLSQKPIMILLNCAEESAQEAQNIATKLRPHLPDNVEIVAACAGLEAELASMAPEDQAAFMAEYGIKESIRARIIRLASETLGLISFLTVGEDECRAWPIKRGMSAQEAAATIHTDLSDRFIRAETVAYDDFIRHGDFGGCKKAGVWRLEGKQYIVQDGDILSIRAGA